MSKSLRLLRIAGVFLLASWWSASSPRASDPPDSLVNPTSHFIEVVDAPVVSTGTDIRHTIEPGKLGEKTVTWVSTDAANDSSPRIAIAASGDTWVAWSRDAATSSVEIRTRNRASGTWGATRRVSEAGESSANPEIVHDGDSAWVAFEIELGDDTAIAVSVITDEPDPILTRSLLASTSFGGTVDTAIHYEASKLWVTWVDSPSEIGWSAYSYASGSWSAPAYQPYFDGNVAAARRVVRTAIVGEP